MTNNDNSQEKFIIPSLDDIKVPSVNFEAESKQDTINAMLRTLKDKIYLLLIKIDNLLTSEMSTNSKEQGVE